MKMLPVLTIHLCLISFFLLNVAWAETNNEIDLQATKAIELIDTNLDEAERIITSVLEKNPSHAMVNFYCGRIMGRQAGDAFFSALSYAKKSLRCLKKAVELEPNNIKFRKGLVNFYLGAPSIAGGDEGLALEQIKAIKRMDPRQALSTEFNFYRKIDELNTFENELKTNLYHSVLISYRSARI